MATIYEMTEQEKSIIKLPKCCECDELIQDNYCYQFDG